MVVCSNLGLGPAIPREMHQSIRESFDRVENPLALASLGAVTAITGCGGGFGLRSATSYTITVTGTSGAEQQTATVQLTVQ